MPRRAPQSKPPAFQFYVRDWVLSTLGMSREMKGAYVDLLCFSWDNGPLPDDAEWRQRVIGGTAQGAARIWMALRPRWRLTKRGWVNPRLERQRKALGSYSARAKKAAITRWSRRSAGDAQASLKHASSNAPSTARRMLKSTLRASSQALLERSTASSSADQDQDQPATERPAYTPPFKTYAAIAGLAVEQTSSDDVGAIAETFKQLCARQQIPYGPEITQKAVDAVLHTRAKRRA